MKRHPALIPVSQQHHGGLLTARLLQKNAPAYKGMPTTVAGKKAYVLAFLETDLLPHFRLEEDTIFVFAQQASAEMQHMALQLTEEHRQLKAAILALTTTEEQNMPAMLDRIGKLLEQHIRTEERVFFEQLQQELPEAELRLLQLRIEAHQL